MFDPISIRSMIVGAIVGVAVGVGSSAAQTLRCLDLPGAPAAAWMASMPDPPFETSFSRSDAMVESEDGTLLAARAYVPDAFSTPLPAILWTTPYLGLAKRGEDLGLRPIPAEEIRFFLCRGYAVVAADLRGSHASGGCPDFGGPADRADGAAIVEWITAQPEYVVPAGHRLELVIASSDFCGDILLNLVGDCRVFGVISDPSGATVTVREGETRLRLVTAPL